VGARKPLDELDPAFPLLEQAAGKVGAQAWAVGGYVRDRLLGRDHPDLDIVVAGEKGTELAQAFAELAGAPPPVLFERFGTAQVNWQGRLIEFASTRAESYAPDSRKPDVTPATLDEDLRRRDFTVNTLLMDFQGQVEDRLGTGLRDLEARVLRTPREPEATFADDPLRMLRAARLAAQLGFELAPDLLPAMRKARERLRPPVLSVERTADELRKMLLSERPKLALQLLDEGGLLEIVLPEVWRCHGVQQGGWHRFDVYEHTLEALALAPPDLLTRLAALFHDVGKPVTATPDGYFLGHDKVGAGLAREALARLRFSKEVGDRVARLVELHLRPAFYQREEWGDGAVRKLARDAGDDVWRLLDLARADIRASAFPDPAKIDELENRLREVLAEKPSRFSLPISGEDIMHELKLPPGKDVGRVKSRLQELVLDGQLPPEREALLEYLRAHPNER